MHIGHSAQPDAGPDFGDDRVSDKAGPHNRLVAGGQLRSACGLATDVSMVFRAGAEPALCHSAKGQPRVANGPPPRDRCRDRAGHGLDRCDSGAARTAVRGRVVRGAAQKANNGD
jgi:hypothetical protein